MHRPRAFFAAAELPNGNVLVAGGFHLGINFADSEIYNWHTGLWTPTASMKQARSAPVAVHLENGRVMVIGGFDEHATAGLYMSNHGRPRIGSANQGLEVRSLAHNQ
jgi:hypothetical protein